MATNTNLLDVTHKSLFPTLISSNHELYSLDSETLKYSFHNSKIEKALSSVEEKDKLLPIATVGIISSHNNGHHKIYTDLLIQYLEHRLQTNEKVVVEKFVKDFDDHCARLTSSSNGVYFWPRVFTITSKKKERCRLLILFFDGVANTTLEILASALCSQMYVFKEDGIHHLETELHTLRDSFSKASNVTLRNPCTTIIKSENDSPRSFRIFLKDWVDFHLDFFKHKETMFSDWEQLMRYLVKTEGGINTYISGTELRLINDVSILNLCQISNLPDQKQTGPNQQAPEASGLQKEVTEDKHLPNVTPGESSKLNSTGMKRQETPLDPFVILDNTGDTSSTKL